ncbi:hypothetical protein LPY66_17515 [Dehalobacter sp. DCM]|uniref:hypothetical protein n=1 Tax=Dehalobacter sp. DCM TaxID=2907827 RepID=UPI003081A43E|nr:hypothetical protein LPY66_17515 [Dehalobacter sp. DCM]
MRYLSTKPTRQSFLLLIGIRHNNSRKWLLPIPVWVLEETLEAVQDIAWVWERIIRLAVRHNTGQSKAGFNRDSNKWRHYAAGLPISLTIQTVNDILRELRVQGQYRMIDIEVNTTHIQVDLV